MIARELNISKTTVSLALRGHPRISTTTREKVEAVAKAQGYTIDPHLTRAFSIIQKGRSSTHNVIGYLDSSSRDPEFGNPFAEQVKHNLIESAKNKGFSVTTFEVNKNKMSFSRLRQIIESRNIRYLLVPSPALIDDLELDWDHHSTIVLSTRPLRHRFNRVTTSNYQAVSVLMNQLKKKRYTKPGFIIRRDIDLIQDSECSIAFEGLRQFLKFDASVPILYTSPSTTQQAYERWFWRYQPDVIIQNNRVGITRQGTEDYTEIFSKFTKRLPTKTGRCSLNADPEQESVSGILRNEQEIGYSAIELMLSMIERNVMGLPNHPKTLTIQSDWFQGSTLK